ncbi:hypothetical protein [Pseudodonghicola flavimaris]|uniref:Uncharacterized protein n=1 Tax=Pseudodonghicola flavimaris TaxID=3050036 RepID=A0ABT7F5E7_9RHOB|nr:hypothetical protein [Pseudodonghicola flavimaris]MDK3019834.1 hypothetical protein [Pseudodonghicola flavimaris]
MPTERQIQEALKIVSSMYPDARIARVGPDGVTFDYQDKAAPKDEGWNGKPFSAE